MNYVTETPIIIFSSTFWPKVYIGNMGQDAQPKNRGSYLSNQWMKLLEIDLWSKVRQIFAMHIFSW